MAGHWLLNFSLQPSAFEIWRRWMGIEPTWDLIEPHAGFEDQERHQVAPHLRARPFRHGRNARKNIRAKSSPHLARTKKHFQPESCVSDCNANARRLHGKIGCPIWSIFEFAPPLHPRQNLRRRRGDWHPPESATATRRRPKPTWIFRIFPSHGQPEWKPSRPFSNR